LLAQASWTRTSRPRVARERWRPGGRWPFAGAAEVCAGDEAGPHAVRGMSEGSRAARTAACWTRLLIEPTASTAEPGPARRYAGGPSDPNADRTMSRATPSRRAIASIPIPLAPCGQRISAPLLQLDYAVPPRPNSVRRQGSRSNALRGGPVGRGVKIRPGSMGARFSRWRHDHGACISKAVGLRGERPPNTDSLASLGELRPSNREDLIRRWRCE
jgi:hypothetical protein